MRVFQTELSKSVISKQASNDSTDLTGSKSTVATEVNTGVIFASIFLLHQHLAQETLQQWPKILKNS